MQQPSKALSAYQKALEIDPSHAVLTDSLTVGIHLHTLY